MSRLRIPERVTLLGRAWTVVRPERWGREDCDGYTIHTSRTIEIRRDLDEDYALEVYLHECLHAVFPGSVVSDRVQDIIAENTDKGLADAVRGLVEGEG